MTKVILQSEVNQACEQLENAKKAITISSVIEILGKGTHSQLVDAVLRYKESPEKAKKASDTSIVISDCDKKIKNKSDSFSLKLKKLLTEEKTELSESGLLKLIDLINHYFSENLTKKEKETRKEVQKLHIQIDHLETQLIDMSNKLKEKETLIEYLNHQNLLATRPDKPKANFQTNKYSVTQAEKTPKVTSVKPKVITIEKQLSTLESTRMAAYDYKTGSIILKVKDFDGPLLKTLRYNRQELTDCDIFYEYETRFYHLSNYTKSTINFLNNNHFSFSKELTKELKEKFNH